MRKMQTASFVHLPLSKVQCIERLQRIHTMPDISTLLAAVKAIFAEALF